MPGKYTDKYTYVIPLLRVLARRGASPPSEVYDEVAKLAGISEQEKERTNESDGALTYRNCIQWARQSLVYAGALLGSSDPGWKRGVWEITEAGRALANEPSEEKLFALIRQREHEGFLSRDVKRKQSRALAGLDETESELVEPLVDDENHIPKIQALVDAANASPREELLDRIRSMNDTAFEYLVGDVLKNSLRADEVQVTQQSRDGGIDGILKFDSLGMRIAVYEAKRYAEGNTVSRPQMDAFATAKRRRKAAHALFVTSSSFSVEAIQTAREEDIRLIDGEAFVDLMAKARIGLKPKQTFTVYEVDPTWDAGTADT